MKTIKTLTLVLVLICIGSMCNAQKADAQKDTVYSVADVDVKPEYPGGDIARQNFIEKNVNGFVPIDNGAPKGTYNIVIICIIDELGKIIGTAPETNYGYGMEKEVLRVIRKLPKPYTPALKNGVPVKTKIKFPVTFSIS